MSAGIYTNRGEEVPLGMECALPYLQSVAEVMLQQPASGGHAGAHPLVLLPQAHSTPSPFRSGTALANPTLHLVKGDRLAATFERPDSVHA